MTSGINQIIQNNNTVVVSCINTEINVLEEELMNILSAFGDNWLKEKYQLVSNKQLDRILCEPDSESIKFLLWTPELSHKKFSIFINNFSDGWVTLLNNYSLKYQKGIVMATFSNETCDYPIYRFYYIDKSYKRTVQVQKEVEKWEFYEEGRPLEIEDLANYTKKYIGERLNNSIIVTYMRKLGFDFDKNEFWLSKDDAIEYTLPLQ